MLQLINDFLWTKILIFVLIGLGLTFTIASRFVQFPFLGRMFGVLRQAFRGAPELVSGIDAKRRRARGRWQHRGRGRRNRTRRARRDFLDVDHRHHRHVDETIRRINALFRNPLKYRQVIKPSWTYASTRC